MEVMYLGGANEVGASSILLKINGKNLLLDCGIRQSKVKDKLPDFSLIHDFGGIDAILISHAHMDHIGSLPLISKEYPNAFLYMNHMTLDLARVLLYDSLKIMNYTEAEIPMFQEQDVLSMFDRVRLIPYQKESEILEGIKITFYMAGHIAGASAIHITSREGTVFYTGDFSLTPAHTINGMAIPKLRPDVVISETTYGDKLHANREAEENRLVEKVKEVLERKGKILIPVFALGRSQEVLFILKRAIAKKRLPDTPIYVDGMVQNINSVFQNNPLYLKENLGKKILREKEIFYDENVLKVVDDAMRKKIVESPTPCIVVSSSGMLIGGRSEFYASHFVEQEDNAIILTGYQDEESNGRMLLNLLNEPKEKRKLSLHGSVHSVLCDIDIVGLSAHADKQEIKNLMTMLQPKTLILGHGEETIIDSFARELAREMNLSIYVPRVGEKVSLAIKNPRKQIHKTLEFLYSKNGSMEDFYEFIKTNYGTKLFTKEDLAYIYFGSEVSEGELLEFTKTLIDSIYFTQDKRRYFLFRISEEIDILKEQKKELTNQDLEEMLLPMLKDYPYKKLSFYPAEKRIVVTFDFPKVIDASFDTICACFKEKTGFQVEKNENINNFACETVIKEMLGEENIDKISYLPMEDCFKVKVYEFVDVAEILKEKIGYDVELVVVPKKGDAPILSSKRINGKMEQNAALSYIDAYFQEKEDKPYKKGLKNGGILLSFITYEIGLKYEKEFLNLSEATGYSFELNRNANMVMVFQELNQLLTKYSMEKKKNPSYSPLTNLVSVKLEPTSEENIGTLKKEFKKKTGLDLVIE